MRTQKTFQGYTLRQLLARAKLHPDTRQLQVTVRTRAGTVCCLRTRIEAPR